MTTPDPPAQPGQPTRSRKRTAAKSSYDDYVYDAASSLYINKEGDSLNRVEAKEKRRQDDAKLAEETRQAALKKKQEADDEIRNRPAAAPGNRGDGGLHLAFIPVGQGDCAIMSTPQGRVVLFDCGSLAGEGEDKDKVKDPDDLFVNRVRSVIEGPKFLGNSKDQGSRNLIDILITTHPDSDHYNKLQAVLGTRYIIDNWYFSGKSIDYAVGGTSAFLWGCLAEPKVNAQKKVVLNADPSLKARPGAVTINGNDVPEPKPGAATAATEPKLDGAGGIRILDEPNCKISILAADVHYDYSLDGSTDINRGSVVTLIEAFGKKILMCGDATSSTEEFLKITTKPRIGDLHLVQAGHHGSDTSSSEEFVKLVNPFKVVVSAGMKILKYHLPYEDVIVSYRKQLADSNRPQVTEHTTWYWSGGVGAWKHEGTKSPYEVYTTGSWTRAIEVDIPPP